MTTLDEARNAWKRATQKYQEKFPSRTAIMGDGRGLATSNLFVPNRSNYIFARDNYDSHQFFQILNRAKVNARIDLPVILGYTEEEPQEEQVLSIHYDGLGAGMSASNIGSTLGPHHLQHQFRGGDEVFIDSRMFLTGLVHPTSPLSMTVTIEAFPYFYDKWRQYAGGTSANFNQWKPSGMDMVFVMVALDPTTQTIVYRPGFPFVQGSVANADFFTLGLIPGPSGNEFPLAYIKLTSSTTAIDWTGLTDNIGDARLFVQPPLVNILDRLRQLEGLSESEPSLPALLVANNTVNITADAYGRPVGLGAENRVAYWSNRNTLMSSANLTFDGTTLTMLGAGHFGVGTTGIPAAIRLIDAREVFSGTASVQGYLAQVDYSLSGNSAFSANGVRSVARLVSANNLTATFTSVVGGGLVGGFFSVRTSGASAGIVTAASGITTDITLTSGTFTEVAHHYSPSPALSGGATIGIAYGHYIDKQKVTGVTTGYGIYQADSADQNYFAGNVGIGTLTFGTSAIGVLG